MKSISIFCICLLAAFSAAAQTSATATFFAAEGEKFWVIMDGIKQNANADANVKVTGLTKENYQVKIIFADSKLGSINKMIYTKNYEEKFADVTYKVAKNKKGAFVVSISSFSEAQPGNPSNASVVPHTDVEPVATQPAATTQPATNNTGSINQNVSMTNTKTTTSQTVTSPEGDRVTMDMNMGATGGNVKVDDGMGGGVNMNLGINISGMDGTNGATQSNSSTTVTRTTTTTTYSSTGGGLATTPGNTQPLDNTRPGSTTPVTTTPVTTPPAANTGGCSVAASSTDLENLKGSIKKQSFSENKMNAAKAFLKAKCLSVTQIKDIMGLFSFEADKLAFAKLAYDRCANKEDYYMVGDAFSFSSSQDELMEYVNSK